MGVYCHCCKFCRLTVCEDRVTHEDGEVETVGTYLALECTCDEVDPNGFDGFDFFNTFEHDAEKNCKHFESNGMLFYSASGGHHFPTED